MLERLGSRSRTLLVGLASALPAIVLALYVARLQSRERALRQTLDRLSRQAMTDELTGLYNKRFFGDALSREITVAKRTHAPFSVILLDLDRFKRVNDTWGHDAGDAVLREVATVLQRSVRGSDIAVRHGGEEFAILLPNTALAAAAGRAESLRAELERHVTDYGAERISISASFGVAQHGPGTDDPVSLMKAADAAMYAAKAAGRNRVVVDAPPGSSAAHGQP